MFFKRNRVEVVPASELTDYSERFAEFEKMREEDRKFASRKDVAIATIIPVAASVGFIGYQFINNSKEVATSTVIAEPVNAIATPPTPIFEPSTLTETFTPLAVNAIPQQTNIVADASLTALATILDPIIDILVAISFPIASIMVVCAFFLIMIGNKDKAFDIMLNAGLGYILIQLSPVFLEILKTVGDTL